MPSSSSSSCSAAAQPLVLFSLTLSLLLSSCSFAAALRYQPSSLKFDSPAAKGKGQAERMIRSLNLFPQHEANIVLNDDYDQSVHDEDDDQPRISEKQFSFNVTGTGTGGGSGPSVQQLGHYAGYYSLPSTKGAKMFYFFFESRVNKTDAPVVIWLTGGPGCASELALFYENGPFKISDDMSLQWNDYGWDLASNILYVDQPTGTGFSYTTDDSDIRHNEVGVSNDLYNFLQEFFKGHSKYAGNDFYITGESYAGHYIPALASRIFKGNKNNEGIHINMKGFAIGNGLTDPAFQYRAYPDFALAAKLISKSDHDSIVADLVPSCESAISACKPGSEESCADALSTCNQIFQSILNIAGNINYYDIRKQCEGSLCYDFSQMENFLSLEKVKSAIGVKASIGFVSCSSEVYNAMTGDWMIDYETGIPTLLESGIKVLIYAGEYDLICNWLGNSNWVNGMKWSGQAKFQAAPNLPFLAGNTKSGELKSFGPLAFLKVYNAGHMVPMDQPKAALQMLQGWMQGKL